MGRGGESWNRVPRLRKRRQGLKLFSLRWLLPLVVGVSGCSGCVDDEPSVRPPPPRSASRAPDIPLGAAPVTQAHVPDFWKSMHRGDGGWFSDAGAGGEEQGAD